MGDRKDTFHYTYSARQQEEIRNIRKKYLPQEPKEDKMEQFLSEYAARNNTDKALKQAILLWTDMHKKEGGN